MHTIDKVFSIIILVIGILTAYQMVVMVIGIFCKSKKFKKTNNQYKYAVFIGARNEESVIGNLIDSIKKQNYPQDKLTIFVVADHCTDKTAQIARDMGAIVYERDNAPKKQRRRSCAFDFIIKEINKDIPGGITSFDGVFIHDADNLLSKNYVSEMNNAFDDKRYGFFTSYINVKNMHKSFFSAWNGSNLYGQTLTKRGKTLLGMSIWPKGNSMLIRSELLKDGYKWQTYSEDVEFSYYSMAKGVRSAQVEDAEIFDEQSETFYMTTRQQLRYQRGNLHMFFKLFFVCFIGLFTTRSLTKKLSSYDAFISIIPTSIITLFIGFLYPLAVAIYKVATLDTYSLTSMFVWVGGYYGITYLRSFAINAACFIREYKRIRIKPIKLILYSFIFPLVNIMYSYIVLYALIMPIKWKPIQRFDPKPIERVYDNATIAEQIQQKKSLDKTRELS